MSTDIKTPSANAHENQKLELKESQWRESPLTRVTNSLLLALKRPSWRGHLEEAILKRPSGSGHLEVCSVRVSMCVNYHCSNVHVQSTSTRTDFNRRYNRSFYRAVCTPDLSSPYSCDTTCGSVLISPRFNPSFSLIYRLCPPLCSRKFISFQLDTYFSCTIVLSSYTQCAHVTSNTKQHDCK